MAQAGKTRLVRTAGCDYGHRWQRLWQGTDGCDPTAAVAVNGRGACAADAGGNGGSVVQGTG